MYQHFHNSGSRAPIWGRGKLQKFLKLTRFFCSSTRKLSWKWRGVEIQNFSKLITFLSFTYKNSMFSHSFPLGRFPFLLDPHCIFSSHVIHSNAYELSGGAVNVLESVISSSCSFMNGSKSSGRSESSASSQPLFKLIWSLWGRLAPPRINSAIFQMIEYEATVLHECEKNCDLFLKIKVTFVLSLSRRG